MVNIYFSYISVCINVWDMFVNIYFSWKPDALLLFKQNQSEKCASVKLVRINLTSI